MFRLLDRPTGRPRRSSGLTLVEMLMAMGIMGIMAGVMAALAITVQETGDYNYGRGTAAQHARVALERIRHMVVTATTAKNYPGVAVVYDQSGTYLFPDTLLVWHPAGAPANPSGPPLISEIIFYCPDPNTPNQLIELTAPTNAQTIPLDSATLNTASWRTTIAAIKTANTSQKTLLTELLRTGQVTQSGTSGPGLRGAVRFNLDLHPTAAEWSAYQGGSLTWNNIAWPQGIYGSVAGMRQAWVHTELQLLPAQLKGQQDNSGGQLALPFFGSAALYSQVTP
jgi:pilin/secretion family protein with methylation motif